MPSNGMCNDIFALHKMVGENDPLLPLPYQLILFLRDELENSSSSKKKIKNDFFQKTTSSSSSKRSRAED